MYGDNNRLLGVAGLLFSPDDTQAKAELCARVPFGSTKLRANVVEEKLSKAKPPKPLNPQTPKPLNPRTPRDPEILRSKNLGVAPVVIPSVNLVRHPFGVYINLP